MLPAYPCSLIALLIVSNSDLRPETDSAILAYELATPSTTPTDDSAEALRLLNPVARKFKLSVDESEIMPISIHFCTNSAYAGSFSVSAVTFPSLPSSFNPSVASENCCVIRRLNASVFAFLSPDEIAIRSEYR